MASVNKVTILGNCAKDAEVRYSPEGTAFANLTVATNRTWKDKNSGDKKEEAEFHRVSFFGRLAEIAGDYLSKGKPVYISGRLRTRKWQDKDGQDRYTTEIVAEEMQLLGSGRDGGGSGGDESGCYGGGREGRESAPARDSSRSSGAGGGGQGARKPVSSFEDMDDDIPF